VRVIRPCCCGINNVGGVHGCGGGSQGVVATQIGSDMGMPVTHKTNFHDNQTTISLFKNLVVSAHSKHIDVLRYFERECVALLQVGFSVLIANMDMRS
jgi:hypothetical protein